MVWVRSQALEKRHMRVRAKISGTPERPRLCINRSLKHLYVQVIDDTTGKTLCAATTNNKAARAEAAKNFSNVKGAKQLGAEVAKAAGAKGLSKVVFDRGGNRYHGVIKAFAEAAREAGLKF